MKSDKRILVIEDEADYRSIVSQLLEKEGFSVTSAETAADGLRGLEKNMPDLIILDIGLPDASGLDVCRRLRSEKRTAGVPIILFTVRSELGQVSQALECGATDYILKPFDIGTFVERVKGVLRSAKA